MNILMLIQHRWVPSFWNYREKKDTVSCSVLRSCARTPSRTTIACIVPKIGSPSPLIPIPLMSVTLLVTSRPQCKQPSWRGRTECWCKNWAKPGPTTTCYVKGSASTKKFDPPVRLSSRHWRPLYKNVNCQRPMAPGPNWRPVTSVQCQVKVGTSNWQLTWSEVQPTLSFLVCKSPLAFEGL